MYLQPAVRNSSQNIKGNNTHSRPSRMGDPSPSGDGSGLLLILLVTCTPYVRPRPHTLDNFDLAIAIVNASTFLGRLTLGELTGSCSGSSVSAAFDTHGERADFFASFEPLPPFLPASSLGMRESILVTVSSLNWYQSWFLHPSQPNFPPRLDLDILNV